MSYLFFIMTCLTVWGVRCFVRICLSLDTRNSLFELIFRTFPCIWPWLFRNSRRFISWGCYRFLYSFSAKCNAFSFYIVLEGSLVWWSIFILFCLSFFIFILSKRINKIEFVYLLIENLFSAFVIHEIKFVWFLK